MNSGIFLVVLLALVCQVWLDIGVATENHIILDVFVNINVVVCFVHLW